MLYWDALLTRRMHGMLDCSTARMLNIVHRAPLWVRNIQYDCCVRRESHSVSFVATALCFGTSIDSGNSRDFVSLGFYRIAQSPETVSFAAQRNIKLHCCWAAILIMLYIFSFFSFFLSFLHYCCLILLVFGVFFISFFLSFIPRNSLPSPRRCPRTHTSRVNQAFSAFCVLFCRCFFSSAALASRFSANAETKTKARQIFENLWFANLICNAIVFMRVNENGFWLCNQVGIFFFASFHSFSDLP